MHFCASSHTFRDINIARFLLSKSTSRSLSKVVAMTPFLKIVSNTFFHQLLPFQRYNNFTFFTSKSRIRSQIAIWAISLFGRKCQNQIFQIKSKSHKFLCQLLLFQRYKNLKFVNFKKQVKVTKCNFCNYIIRWPILLSTNISYKFLHQLLPFQRCIFFHFYFQKVSIILCCNKK